MKNSNKAASTEALPQVVVKKAWPNGAPLAEEIYALRKRIRAKRKATEGAKSALD